MSPPPFKVCGLCSKVVVEDALQPSAALRRFLLNFLAIAEPELPGIICSDCFQGANDCKMFREQCVKGLDRMRKAKMPQESILGWPQKKATKVEERSDRVVKESPGEVESSVPKGRISRSRAALELASNKKSSRSSGTLLDPLALPAITPKSSKSKEQPQVAKGKVGKNFGVKKTISVEIKEIDRLKAEEAGARGGSVKVKKRRNEFEIVGALSITELKPSPKPVAGVKRSTRSAAITPGEEPTKKRAKVQAASPPKGKNKPLVEDEGAAATTTVSSFGRLRRSTSKHKHYVDLDTPESSSSVFLARDPHAGTATPRSRGAIRKAPEKPTPLHHQQKPNKRTGSKAEPASKKKQPLIPKHQDQQPKYKMRGAKVKPGGFYYVDDDGEVDQPPPISKSQNSAAVESLEYEDNSEDNFPSIGPYQCEICSQITDTKGQFVKHIKQLHIDDVDEEVLRSLENDIKRNKNTPAKKSQKGAGADLASSKKKFPQKASVEPAKKKPVPASKTGSAVVMEASNNSTTNAISSPLVDETAPPASTTGLDGEVTTEETHVASRNNSHHWKASVARKYEQESSVVNEDLTAGESEALTEKQVLVGGEHNLILY